MAYMNWVIGGLTPSWVEPDFKDDRENHTLTLKCAAIYDVIGTDPMTEIEQFHELSSERIINTPLQNGGTNLQVVNGHIFSVSSDGIIWERCALHRVSVQTDSYYNGNNPGSVIEYELVIEYAVQKDGGSSVYTPPYNQYSNIEFYMTSDKSPAGVAVYGEEIGWMKIVEPKPVRMVEVYGSACAGNEDYPAYIEVNGEKREWHYSHDGMACNTLPVGWEKLTFILDTPATVLTIQTSTHVYPFDSCSNNQGAWLQWIRTTYDDRIGVYEL